jgi:hypothetical protein
VEHRIEPPPLLATQAEYEQLVSEVEVQTAKSNWFNGALVLMATTFFLYMFVI